MDLAHVWVTPMKPVNEDGEAGWVEHSLDTANKVDLARRLFVKFTEIYRCIPQSVQFQNPYVGCRSQSVFPTVPRASRSLRTSGGTNEHVPSSATGHVYPQAILTFKDFHGQAGGERNVLEERHRVSGGVAFRREHSMRSCSCQPVGDKLQSCHWPSEPPPQMRHEATHLFQSL